MAGWRIRSTRLQMFKALALSGVLCLLNLIILYPAWLSAAIDLPVGDWRYETIERAVLTAGIDYPLNTKPLTNEEIDEIARLAGKQGWIDSEMVWAILDLGIADKDVILSNSYNQGYSQGLNLIGQMTGQGRLLLDYDLSLRGSINHHGSQISLQWGYLRLPFKGVELTIGRSSHWWGPGRHASWLLTNNAPTFDQISLRPSIAKIPPGALKYLGRSRFELIYGRLSKQRIVYKYQGTITTKYAQPQFMGLRFGCSPNKYLDLGVGGSYMISGRDGLSVSDYLKALFPNQQSTTKEMESGPITDRLGAIDVTIKIPFSKPHLKGLKVYWEYGGEDSVNSFLGLPSLSATANLFGLYLDAGQADLSMEYAESEDDCVVWYTHSQFTNGYRHHDAVLGHEMGGGTRDLWLRISYILTPAWTGSLELERKSGLSKEKRGNLQLYNGQWRLKLGYSTKDGFILRVVAGYIPDQLR